MKRTLGICYYPEHWPEAMWADDARRMAESGLTWVRIGEFAWSRIEPEPGLYDWGWLDRAVETLGDAGLKVILGTPTSTPPRWMLDKWPDMLPVGADGQIRKFGSRRHYCFSHPGFREDCATIVRLLGARYGRSPHVKGWQIDNEYGNHSTVLSFSPAALAGFRLWLERKYGNIKALNEAWGNVFWSMEYNRFDQIELPNQTVAEANPSHWMDFRRYSSDQVGAFTQVQTNILRASGPAPLIHNFMTKSTDFDHFEVAKNLDIASWDSYPLGYLEKHSTLGDAWIQTYVRQGDPDFQAFHHDLYRAVGRGRHWIMEQQPGPVNWAAYNPAPLPGMVRLWTWEAYAHGAEAVCYFRWRQAPFAQEQMHAGLMRPDNIPAPALAEVQAVAAELKAMPTAETGAAPVALVFDYPSVWAWQTQPQGKGFEYFGLVFDFYRALRKLGLSIDIVPSDCASLGQYRVVAVPGLLSLAPALQQALEVFDGTVIAGPRSGSKTPDMQIPTGLPPRLPGFDCTVEYVESLRPGLTQPLSGGGAFRLWSEKLSSRMPVRETHANGDPAIVGDEKHWYVGGWPDEAALHRILQQACAKEGLPTVELSGGLRIRDTATHRFFFNYGPEAQVIDGLEVGVAEVKWAPRGAA
ncbi:MAG: beta-galactosidase [Candidatus Kaistia colombiensis]|nr:MAG: beta-galactosidase [Kaistia sp.]